MKKTISILLIFLALACGPLSLVGEVEGPATTTATENEQSASAPEATQAQATVGTSDEASPAVADKWPLCLDRPA